VMTGAALEPHEPTAEQAQRYRLTAMEGSAAPSLRRPADLRWLVLSGSLAGLIMSVTVLRLAVARAAADPTVLGVFVAVALMVGFMAEEATRRTRQAARAAEAARRIAEADRMRTVLLATVSHDLRTPLAAAKAALRSRAVQLTADDHAELLATAEESLDQLSPVSRLAFWTRAGCRPARCPYASGRPIWVTSSRARSTTSTHMREWSGWTSPSTCPRS
jgi:signal transduction histidine kinase